MLATPSLAGLGARVRAFIGQILSPCGGREGATGPEAEPAFTRLASELFALQYEHVAPYRRLCAHRGLSPANLGHWRDIPAVPTAAFKEFEFTGLAPMERARVFLSSGTTQHRPSRHFHSAASLALYAASAHAGFAAASRQVAAGAPGMRGNGGLDAPREFLALTPPPADAPHSSLVHMFDTLGRAEGAGPNYVGRLSSGGAWEVVLEAAAAALAESQEGQRPVVLLGTAFGFVHLLDGLETTGRPFRLPPGSWALETGGYKGHSRALPRAKLHGLLAERLGLGRARIISEYGMCELSSQAYSLGAAEPGDAPVFRFPPWARTLVACPETGREVAEGETGLLRVYDLANVWSVLAVQTEDLAVRRGAGFELCGRAATVEARGCSLLAAD